MLKNHKILSGLIVLITAGILTVLSFWLYNSYQGHRELASAQTDQALLAVLSDYYSERDLSTISPRDHYLSTLARMIHQHYPEVSTDSIYVWMDQNATHLQDSLRRRYRDWRGRAGGSHRRPRDINAWFLHGRERHLSAAALDSMQAEYREELAERGLHHMHPRLRLIKINTPRQRPSDDRRPALPTTRPILVDPDGEWFLVAELPQLWQHIVLAMMGQILFSLILMLALLATFFTLLQTIRKQQKLARLQRTFVTNMTHELKTPLSTVSAALEAIQRYGAKDDMQKREKYLEISKRELEHLTAMVERVLQFNIGDSQGIKLHKTTFDLVDLCRETVAAFNLSAYGRVQFSLKHTPLQIPLFADAAHLRNVLSNLLDNAVKYNRSDHPRVEVTLSADPRQVAIRVKDNGIGIPRTYQGNIFELFFRVPTEQIYNVKGFGLGLAYVHQIVQQHGGTIRVASTENEGTVFDILLPNERDPAAPPSAKQNHG